MERSQEKLTNTDNSNNYYNNSNNDDNNDDDDDYEQYDNVMKKIRNIIYIYMMYTG